MVVAAALRLAGAALATGSLVWLALTLGPPPRPRWAVVERVSAHRALVLQVEMRDPADALDAARTLVAGEQPGFDEVLVYVHSPGRRDLLRRVRWTPQHGYEETRYR